MADVFISCRPEDRDKAMDIALGLQTAGFQAVLPPMKRLSRQGHTDLPPELRHAKCVLVLWSCFSVHSEIVWAQAKYAWDKRILVTALLDANHPPFPFDDGPAADLSEWRRGVAHPAWQDLLAAVSRVTGKESIAVANGGGSPDDIPLPRLVEIPAGSFTMGSPEHEEGHTVNERPMHEVTFARPFLAGQTAVTFEEYDVFCRATSHPLPDDAGWGRGRRPVINVSCHDAQDYCTWLTQKTGQPYRLLSEAEWEYCCRAGTTTPFSFGNTITTDEANFNGQIRYGRGRRGIFRRQTLPVKSFPANDFGLYEMHGNVWEWCQDRWRTHYRARTEDGSPWLEGSIQERAVRGGSWTNEPVCLRSACRIGSLPHLRFDLRGFRVARSI